jgi:hypothetical protein
MQANIILIDFENVQPRNLASLRGRPVMTKVFIGANQNKIPFEMAAELQPLGQDVEYIRIQASGRNALDFHIAYYIGRLAAEFPNAVFHIISKDTGFDPLIKHLKTQNITCHRSGSLTDIPGLEAARPAPAATAKAAPDRLQKVANVLLRRGTSKPRRLKTLTTSIKALLGKQATDAEVSELIAQLTQRGLLTVADGKVTYPAE